MIKFNEEIFHPNIYNDGKICIDILKENWTPTYDLLTILISLRSLLCDPNPNSPANSVAARMFVDDRKEYNKIIREFV